MSCTIEINYSVTASMRIHILTWQKREKGHKILFVVFLYSNIHDMWHMCHICTMGGLEQLKGSTHTCRRDIAAYSSRHFCRCAYCSSPLWSEHSCVPGRKQRVSRLAQYKTKNNQRPASHMSRRPRGEPKKWVERPLCRYQTE